MPDRNYQPTDFGSAQQSMATQSEFNPRNQGAPGTRILGDPNWRSQFLASMGNDLSRLMGQMAQVNLNQKYLDGASKAGVVQSEADLQTDRITKDWEVAGYRDTMGKLALADAQATFETDLPKLREQGPEAIQQYLQKRRDSMAPALQSMSSEARANAMGQLLLQDRAATAKWQGERAKYIVEQKQQAISAQWDVHSRGMQATNMQLATGAATDAQQVETLRNASGFLIGSIWGDSSLPDNVKQSLTVDALRSELSRDNVALYEYLQGAQLPDGSSLMQAIPMEERIKLGNDYRSARDRTSDARNFAMTSALAVMETDIQEGRYKGTFDELNRTLQPLVQNKVISSEKQQSIQRNFLEAKAKAEQTTEIAGMAMRGDIEGLTRIGADPSKGAEAIDAMATRNGLNADQRLAAHVQAANNGLSASSKRVGEIAGPAFAQVRNSTDGMLLEQHKKVMDSLYGMYERDTQQGNTALFSNALSGMPEQDRVFAARIMQFKSQGYAYDQAIARAKELSTTESGMSASARAGAGTKVMREINSMDARGWWQTFKNWLPMTSGDNALQPYDNQIATENLQHVKSALTEEAQQVLLVSPYADKDAVLVSAQAAVLRRTLNTDAGSIIFPKGSTPGTVLGIPPAMQGELSGAVSDLLQPSTAGGTFDMMLINGNIVAQEHRTDGAMVGSPIVLRPDQIQAKVRERVDNAQGMWDRVYGLGVKVLDGVHGTEINGDNTAGVPNTVAYEFRQNLKTNEGFKLQQYTDTNGVRTFGIGVSEKSKYWQEPKGASGQYTPEQVRSSFMQASNDALAAGARTAQMTGATSKGAVLLFSEMAYQGGEEFATRDVYKPMLTAIVTGKAEAAVQAFHSTPVYKAAGQERREHYERLIRRASSGN